jgi:cell division protein FtsW
VAFGIILSVSRDIEEKKMNAGAVHEGKITNKVIVGEIPAM